MIVERMIDEFYKECNRQQVVLDGTIYNGDRLKSWYCKKKKQTNESDVQVYYKTWCQNFEDGGCMSTEHLLPNPVITYIKGG